jgi:hypothetical protein
LKRKPVLFLLIVIFEGIVSLLLLFNIPSDPKNAWLFGYSPERVALAAGVSIPIMIALYLLVSTLQKSQAVFKTGDLIRRWMSSGMRALTTFSGGMIVAGFGMALLLARSFMGERLLPIYERVWPVIFFGTGFSLTLLIALAPYSSNALTGLETLAFVINTGWRWVKLGIIRHLIPLLKFIQRLQNKFQPNLSIFQSALQKHEILIKSSAMILLVLVSIYYYNLAWNHSKFVNTDVRSSDQGAYLEFTTKVRSSQFRYTGGRNRMPIYPYLQALFLTPAYSNQEAFALGKRINIFLSLILLVLLFITTRKFLPAFQALNFTLISAVSVFIYKSGYYQAELLYFFLSFISFLLMSTMLVSPSIRFGLLTGVLLGLAHLTKASVLPGFVLFAIFLLQKWNSTRNLPNVRNSFLSSRGEIKHSALIGLLITGISFFGVVGLYLIESKAVYGKYFYNVNSTFYIWYDSWGKAVEGTRAHGDRVGWPDMPPEEVPSMQKYFAEHSLFQVTQRITNGVQKQLNIIINPYSYFNYPLIYLVIFVFFGVFAAQQARMLARRYRHLFGFSVLYFGSYLFLYTWYAAISWGHRFTYSLYLPLLFGLFFTINQLGSEVGIFHVDEFEIDATRLVRLFNVVIFIIVLGDFFFHAPEALSVGYFGF